MKFVVAYILKINSAPAPAVGGGQGGQAPRRKFCPPQPGYPNLISVLLLSSFFMSASETVRTAFLGQSLMLTSVNYGHVSELFVTIQSVCHVDGGAQTPVRSSRSTRSPCAPKTAHDPLVPVLWRRQFRSTIRQPKSTVVSESNFKHHFAALTLAILL